MRKARVFISCGQKYPKEITIGKSVEEYFAGRNFSTYFAAREHSSEALTGSIFRALRNSEYFVFIDFKRDEIGEKNKKSEPLYRGSLFVNQEIAIATFLGLIGVGFFEKSVKREGILNYHIYNAEYFEDGTEIIKKLDELTKGWDPNSVNELDILISDSPLKDLTIRDNLQRPLSDWYFLVIKNNNKHRHAFSVCGYVTRIFNIDTGEELSIPTNELKWSAIGDISANIMADTSRELVAFYVKHGENKIEFSQRDLLTNSPRYPLPGLPAGKYLLSYSVISSNFETISKSFILEFDGTPQSIVFKEQPSQKEVQF